MATEKKIAANRRNAARSTGPRLKSGKARSSKNAEPERGALPVGQAMDPRDGESNP
jgi:hypothetical protein